MSYVCDVIFLRIKSIEEGSMCSCQATGTQTRLKKWHLFADFPKIFYIRNLDKEASITQMLNPLNESGKILAF